jgi:mannose-6-phosphate isomerase-like protein (cupin superfamily)
MNETESHYKPNGHYIVPKGWGFEEWIINSEKYCGKILRIKEGKKTSWHYHDIKDEVMYVHDGQVKIIYGYEEDINHFETREIILNTGDSFHVPTGMIHQIIALYDTELFEFSTQHFDDDSIRLVKGD